MAARRAGRANGAVARSRSYRHAVLWICGAVLMLNVSACDDSETPTAMRVVGGDPEMGRSAIARYDCGVCHVIPGVEGADGTVGPPLADFGRRSYVAGVAPNQPGILTQWIRNPPAIAPDTAMPNLGVSEEEARHIAAYLYTLR